ncbi:MAG: hypothetical protein JW719_10210 [Pirellulales bacterium]|nr:hypothetical protein [Pirellulales bacterium]
MIVLDRRPPLAWGLLALVLIASAVGPAVLRAQTPRPASGEGATSAATDSRPSDAGVSTDEQLAIDQRAIAAKYEHLEQVLLRMAELTASTDPRRAALLRRVVAESKDRLVGSQFDQMARLLGKGQLSRALENQKDLDRDLRMLLELLLSENRARQAASEKARIREYLKRVGEILRGQKSVEARTAGGGDPRRLAGEQKGLAEKTAGLAKDVGDQDQAARGGSGEGGAGKESPSGNREEGDMDRPEEKDPQEPSDSSEKANPEQKSPEGGPGGDGQGGQGQGGQQGQQGQGGQQGQQGQGSPESRPSSSGEPPSEVQKRLEAAQQHMEDAHKKLDEAQRQGAVEDQEEAIRQLEQAKAELEEILRQLREEEIERMLTFLEARFKKMLEMQRAVYQNTQRLDKVAADRRGREHEIEAGRLGQKQSLIVLEADRALVLLHEDGSSVAFPEAVSQMRDDMRQVALRLARANVGVITQSIEEAVIAALEEMIDALGRAIAQQEARRAQQSPPPQGQPQDPPLVDALAELRMIRALQMRVNQRTARYSKLVDGEQADSDDLLEALRRLSDYQARIYRITRDLEAGENQ